MERDLRHEHVFLGQHHDRNARRTWAVIVLCTIMMVVEIGAGAMFHSMALLADGLHMSTHAGAMLVAAAAYAYARKHRHDPRFSFGTGKLGDLAAFASAIILAMVALGIGAESVARLLNPVAIRYDEAIPVAIVGLLVNIASAWLLQEEHHHHGHEQDDDHDHGHDDDHHDDHDHHGHRDLNLRAAYVHVVSDAAVSILAIAGLVAGRQLGWNFMDPVMGLLGCAVIARWSWMLMGDVGAVLLDMRPRGRLAERIEARLKADGVEIYDLHVWRLGPGHHAAVVSLMARDPQPPTVYKAKLAGLPGLSHVTVEVEPMQRPA